MFQNRNDPDYRQRVIDITDHPATAKIEKLGDQNPERLFYLIELDDAGNHSGFFALLNTTLNRLELARRLGAEPYVCWRNTAYSSSKEENTFERFFNQTCDVTYEEILHSANVIRSRSADGFSRDEEQVYREKEGYLEKIATLYNRYIRILPELELQIEQDINAWVAVESQDGKTETDSSSRRKIFPGDAVFSKTRGLVGKSGSTCRIGVHVRGADYRVNLKGHPSSISFEDYADAVDIFLKDYPDSIIFLATDDQRALDYFNERYSGKICSYPDVFRSMEDLGVHYSKSDRADHAWRLGYEVIRDVKSLAACDILVAGISYVSFAARVNKAAEDGVYREMKIIDHGINAQGVTSAQFNKSYNKPNTIMRES